MTITILEPRAGVKFVTILLQTNMLAGLKFKTPNEANHSRHTTHFFPSLRVLLSNLMGETPQRPHSEYDGGIILIIKEHNYARTYASYLEFINLV